MGYGKYTETNKSKDGGIDGVINQDQLGLEKIYIQSKRYSENKVREPEIRNFLARKRHIYVFVFFVHLHVGLSIWLLSPCFRMLSGNAFSLGLLARKFFSEIIISMSG